MSIFEKTVLPCPSCGKDVPFKAVHSVNVDRSARLREAIIAGDFQREECSSCGTAFRLDPNFNYMDLTRQEWVAVLPHEDVDRWREAEGEMRETYSRAYGAQAPQAAREMAPDVQPRVVFGWAGLWEKIAIGEHGLDDVQLELLKLGMLRSMAESSFGLDTELRLLEVSDGRREGFDPGDLVMAWVDCATAETVEAFRVPRELYDDVAAEPEQWKELRAGFDDALFVDMRRLVLVGA